ncbi:MAG: hypothetical protein KatS3mg002_0214 [Candidatus Woesearchaeota archaeon]|nr:MAG: hypothetical protein KatS3mg002_0214 [Candidatus Woesearchaeota archaeon]
MKAYHILSKMKDEEFNFNEMLMFMISGEMTYYRKLIKEGETKFPRVVQLFRSLKPHKLPEDFFYER